MKQTIIILALLISTLSGIAQKTNELSVNGLTLSFNNKLQLTSLKGNQEYLPSGAEGYLISLRVNNDTLYPQSATWKKNNITAKFEQGIEITLRYEQEKNYLKFTIAEVKNEKPIDAVLYGPFPTTINETIGEIVGVVREQGYAIGMQSLNAKTTGGKLLKRDGSDEARGTAATEESYGSSLQAYCINRNKDRVHTIWNNRIPNAVIQANPDGKLQGSAIALFGCKEVDVLSRLEEIELKEGLPHATINGVWAKVSPEANKPYFITSFTESTIDECLEYTQKLGFTTLYDGGPFSNWGHFDLHKNAFPNGWEGMKACVEKAQAKGIRLGVHTLTNFITTNDAYVSPIPHKGLMTYCKTVLTKPISATDTEIYVENIDGYDFKDACQALRIGDEIIRFAGVSKDKPYRLINCKRGQYKTKAQSHDKGAVTARLADHGYKTLFPTFEFQKEIINNLANFLNHTGVGQIDFDGHEGGWGTGEGEFGMDYFSEQLTKQLNHELRNGSSRSNHYYWHTVSYLNWGEPWYGGFTKSQGHYRYKNQALLKRNYIPNGLGWFLLTPTTTLQEFEYMLARSAGYDAGYALFSKVENFKKNPEFDAIAHAINIWEEARLKKVFSEKQLKLLQDVNRDFSLEKVSDKEFKLQYYTKEKFELLNEMVQPGQPNDVSVDFNVKSDQPFYMVIGAIGESGSINKIMIDFNGFDSFEIETELKSNWAVTYRGDDKLLVYDNKGRFKKAIEFGAKETLLKVGANNIRVSAEFSDGAELKLEGYIRLKDKVETAKAK
ncbi:hypothetical protein EYV94_00775 [Puteibacter caeruleilacunae]|nr:hypothetical protein EYV94_00775 [Puteibacter caeruleilacunae]